MSDPQKTPKGGLAELAVHVSIGHFCGHTFINEGQEKDCQSKKEEKKEWFETC